MESRAVLKFARVSPQKARLVADLVRVKDGKYAAALEVVAGSRLYNVVVEDERTGQALLERGRLQKRVTIIPLNKIAPRPVADAKVSRAEALVGKENELILYGLKQYYTTLSENEKNGKLVEILDDVKFNQVIIFVDSTDRADKLNAMLREATFPSAALHGQVKGKNSNRRGSGRTEMFNDFKAYNTRILVTTDLCARGVDVEHVNVVINYDFPGDADTYMHRIGRAGRFGTKGMAISFVRTDAEQHKAKRAEKTEQEVFDEVQNRFKAKLADLPETIDPSDYK